MSTNKQPLCIHCVNFKKSTNIADADCCVRLTNSLIYGQQLKEFNLETERYSDYYDDDLCQAYGKYFVQIEPI
jgi:hypothetical protein